MKRTGILALLAVVLLLAGCASLNVKVPEGVFMSTGDYVPGIKTLGVIQEKTTVFALLFLIDTNKVHQKLYEALIRRVQALGADGVMDVRFGWKPSPFSALSIFVASGVFDFTVEGIAIKRE
jgi:hypothetical protein